MSTPVLVTLLINNDKVMVRANNFFESCISCESRNRSVFCALSHSALEDIDKRKSCISFKKGETIFHENAFPIGIYCINKGKVKVVHTGNDGRDQIVRLLINGNLIGYRALLCGEKYTASAIAIEDTDVCFIPKEVFFDSLQTDSVLSTALIKMLASELGHAEQIITDLAQKSVRERIAEALLLLREKYGVEPDGATISVALSREDIATLVGTATETAIRLLSTYKQKRIVEFVGKKIKIIDLNALIKAANVHY